MVKRLVLFVDSLKKQSSGGKVSWAVINLLRGYNVSITVVGKYLAEAIDTNLDLIETTDYSRHRVQKLDPLVVSAVQSADILFSLGSITNKNLDYFERAKALKKTTTALVFMQDYYCASFYSVRNSEPCYACLDGSPINSIKYRCVGEGLKNVVRTVYQIKRLNRSQLILRDLNYVIGSSSEQLDSYSRIGVKNRSLRNLPLPFDFSLYDYNEEQKSDKPSDYYVIVAQNRVEKGTHLLPKLLNLLDTKAKVKVLFSSAEILEEFLASNSLKPMYTTIHFGVKSMSSGLLNEIRYSRGIIITSVWPSTTEYVLLEAMHFGKKIFCFDLGIHNDLSFTSDSLVTVPVGDVENLVKEVLNDEANPPRIRQYRKLLNMSGWHDFFQSDLGLNLIK